MKVFDQARKNMVDCQLNTNGVVDRRVLNVFSAVPRELFIPEDKRCAAYIDEDVRLANDSFLLEPLIHARMVQAIMPGPEDNVLNIGDTTGYSSAVFSSLVSTVVVLESKEGQLDGARAIWEANDFCNIAVIGGKNEEGSPEHAPYNLIFINGAVSEVPKQLTEQLAPGGRMACVVKGPEDAIGKIVLTTKLESGICATRTLYDAATFHVTGFEPKPTFKF